MSVGDSGTRERGCRARLILYGVGLGLRDIGGVTAATGTAITLALRRVFMSPVPSGLYKGVIGAASGAGIIIGTYFAFYSTTKNVLKSKTKLNDGSTAFVAGGAAALGSSVVKVPLAGVVHRLLAHILEDVPDMAVKFAVYESLRKVHSHMRGDRPASVVEDLAMGGFAGAAAAAATTPLDVIKTVMMCTASSRPTFFSAAKAIVSEGKGVRVLL
eukprot:jgi/Picre1/32164/NNA_007510.t1